MKAFLFTISLVSNTALGQFSIDFADGSNEGFFDPAARTPVGGNPGTTLGEQRRLVVEKAIEIWEKHIQPEGPVVIEAKFDFIADPTTLAQASPTRFFIDLPEAPEQGVWYVIGLANHFAKRDLVVGEPEIMMRFNTNANVPFYYGLDFQAGSNEKDFLATVLHEIVHGMGFVSTVSGTNGSFVLTPPEPDSFTLNLFSISRQKPWPDLTDSERLLVLKERPGNAWSGRGTQLASSSQITNGFEYAEILTATGRFPAMAAEFGDRLPAGGLAGEIVIVNDGVAPTADACQVPFVNAAEVSGKIALIDRGVCSFATKVQHAQDAGAIAVIIANNVPEFIKFLALGGDEIPPDIPSISVTQETGNALRLLPAGSPIVLHPDQQPGTYQGRPLINTPGQFSAGSSISHWEPTTSPDLLMESSWSPP